MAWETTHCVSRLLTDAEKVVCLKQVPENRSSKDPRETKGSSLPLEDASSSTILHLRYHLPQEKRTEPYKKKPIDSRQTASIFTHGDSFELGESVFSFLNASVLLSTLLHLFSTFLGVGRVVLQRERHDY